MTEKLTLSLIPVGFQGHEAMKCPSWAQYMHRPSTSRRWRSAGVRRVCPICIGSEVSFGGGITEDVSADAAWECWAAEGGRWGVSWHGRLLCHSIKLLLMLEAKETKASNSEGRSKGAKWSFKVWQTIVKCINKCWLIPSTICCYHVKF